MTSGFQFFDRAIANSRLARMAAGLLIPICLAGWLTGCNHHRKQQSIEFSAADCGPCQTMLQQIEYPDFDEDCDGDGFELLTGPPMTISNFQELIPWELTVEECVELALANSKVMQKLGGVVINGPQGVSTLYDQAIVESSGGSVEAALSAFDAQLTSSLLFNRNERAIRPFNFLTQQLSNRVLGTNVANLANYDLSISKQTATGASFTIRNLTDYTRAYSFQFPTTDRESAYIGSAWNMVTQVEARQPLLRGRGTMVNRIAGPDATPGVYNGVLIARIRSDISLADFEIAVRNLVRDVESTYWELYFSYRDLDTKLEARKTARDVWKNRKLRWETGVGRPDDEAIARQQYFGFQTQAQNVLTGVSGGRPGILGSDRNLRRLMGMLSNDGRVIRPISDPSLAPVTFDWEQSQVETLTRRAEIRRQKWTVRQRELELLASKALNKWRFDLVGLYGKRGFGNNLIGGRSAFDNLVGGNLDDWQIGLELGGAIGNRTGHLAIRNAELNLVRERTILKEQQRQILLDLNEAYTEVDRAMSALKTNFDARVAAQEEVIPKRNRVDEGQEPIFFLLDAEQRAANSESAVHRSVADYNLALLNYVYTTGTLLSRYNIHLTEGAWSADAQDNMYKKAPRYERGGPNQFDRDVSPVTWGQFDQSAPRLGTDFPDTTGDSATAPEDPGQSNDLNPTQMNNQFETAPESNGLEAPGATDNGFSKRPRFNFNVPSATAEQYYKGSNNRR